MNSNSIRVETFPDKVVITLNNPSKRNAINNDLLHSLHQALDDVEKNKEISIVVLQAEGDYFCVGMDFEELVSVTEEKNEVLVKTGAKLYMQVLKRFATVNKIIITKLNGSVLAGGVGFVAASDFVIASEKTNFNLSEALWGLLPCNVLPYLIRRVGFQAAYKMCFTTAMIDVVQALKYQLVDEVSQNIEESVRLLSMRLKRLHPDTIADLKSYFIKMWFINEAMETNAIAETTRLALTPRVLNNVKNYINHHLLPWESP